MVPMIVTDTESMISVDRPQRDMLLELHLIYYCQDHSSEHRHVYHPAQGVDWFDISKALVEEANQLEKEKEENVPSNEQERR